MPIWRSTLRTRLLWRKGDSAYGMNEVTCHLQILFSLIVSVYYCVLSNTYVYRIYGLFYEEGNLSAVQKDEARTVSGWA